MTTQDESRLFLLRAVDGEQQLLVDRELIMGRDPGSDVLLDQGGASRQHARLTPEADGVRVEDLGSTNGTFVNGERIGQACLLKEGDQLETGKARFTLVAREPVAEPDPDATQLYSAGSDPDATALHSEGESHRQDPPGAEQPAAAEPEEPDPKAPPSWVLNNQQSVDGTAFFSRDSLQDSLRNSENNRVPQQAVNEPTLVGNSDPVVGMRFQLIGEGKDKWEIGRSPGADVMLNHESVSGSHAQIIHEDGSWKLVDLMSANGTYANGKKCLTGYLSSGDTVCFGSVECAFMLPDETQGPGATPASGKTATESGSGLRTAVIAFVATAAVAGLALLAIAQLL
jgi:pSer/pThr/pTyr-binding forkhead associated (FHA) protein